MTGKVGAPFGNQNATKGKPVSEALLTAMMREAVDEDGKPTKRLHKMTDNVAKKAAEGEQWAVTFVADRLEGKATQSFEGADGEPVIVNILRMDALEDRKLDGETDENAPDEER